VSNNFAGQGWVYWVYWVYWVCWVIGFVGRDTQKGIYPKLNSTYDVATYEVGKGGMGREKKGRDDRPFL